MLNSEAHNGQLKPIATLECNARPWCIDWHPVKKMIAEVGASSTINIWEEVEGRWMLSNSVQTQHNKTIRFVKFSHKGDKIATASFDTTISIFVLTEGKFELLGLLEGHENEVKCVSWSHNDLQLASCSRDKNVQIWTFNPTNYQYECDAILQGHTQDVKCVLWAEEAVLSAGYDNNIRVWMNIDQQWECVRVLEAHQSTVWSLQFSQQNHVYSVDADGCLCIWDGAIDNLKLMTKTLNHHQREIYSVDSALKLILTTGGDDRVLISQLAGQVVTVIAEGHHDNDINCVRASTDYKMFATCSDDKTIKIWPLPVPKE